MACIENMCVNQKCSFYEMANATLKTCPKCGAMIRSFFDEEGDHNGQGEVHDQWEDSVSGDDAG
jgi:hypothetical protein